MAEIKSIQPDNDIFCSVYRKDYIFWREYDRRRKAIHDDHYRLTPEMAARFLQLESKLDLNKMEEYLEDMKELNRMRLRTLYRLEYCPKSSYKIVRCADKEKFSPENDKFLVEGGVKFGIPKGKVMAPLATARRVLGYSAYEDYRTPLSTYENVHGRLGYDRVRMAADGGYWRMGPKYDHEKEMKEIRDVIRRESDIVQRESEEKRREEDLLRKQLQDEREADIRRSEAKRNSRKRGSTVSSKFGPDPRRKTFERESLCPQSEKKDQLTPETTLENPQKIGCQCHTKNIC